MISEPIIAVIFFELCFKEFPMGSNCLTGALYPDCYVYLQFSENLRRFSGLLDPSEGSAA